MGKIKLQKELGLDQRQAKELFNEYQQSPFVKQLSQELIDLQKRISCYLHYTIDSADLINGKLQTKNGILKLIDLTRYHYIQKSRRWRHSRQRC